jgi:DNA-binding transcriptional LysR family regulator
LPKLKKLLSNYSDIKVEINTNYELVDIVAQRFDAGVRLGEQVANDMIAVRIGPDLRMAVVGSPAYFAKYAPPKTPQDLTNHACINIRMPTHGGLYAWEFKKGKHVLNVRVDVPLIVNDIAQMLGSALAGLGPAMMLEDVVQQPIAQRNLQRVLEDWCPSFTGYQLYYPSRRHSSPAFALLVDALRYRA